MLVLAFGPARDALLVMINLPLALIGGIAVRLLRRGRAERGVDHRLHHAVRDCRLPRSRAARRARTAGADPDDRDGRRPRPHPAGARGATAGSELQTPMAIVILCGLTTEHVRGADALLEVCRCRDFARLSRVTWRADCSTAGRAGYRRRIPTPHGNRCSFVPRLRGRGRCHPRAGAARRRRHRLLVLPALRREVARPRGRSVCQLGKWRTGSYGADCQT
jgi:hypothetical protein